MALVIRATAATSAERPSNRISPQIPHINRDPTLFTRVKNGAISVTANLEMHSAGTLAAMRWI